LIVKIKIINLKRTEYMVDWGFSVLFPQL